MKTISLIDSKIMWRVSKNTLMPEADPAKIVSSEYCYMSDKRLLKRISVIFRATKYTSERLHHYPWRCVQRGMQDFNQAAKRITLRASGYTEVK